jgi:hypothetical protein
MMTDNESSASDSTLFMTQKIMSKVADARTKLLRTVSMKSFSGQRLNKLKEKRDV